MKKIQFDSSICTDERAEDGEITLRIGAVP